MTTIERAGPADTGEILTVQRAAYVSEAQLYGDPFIPPLIETAEQVRKAVETATVLVARDASRVVGAVRGQMSGTTCVVGRLVVAPDLQGRGSAGRCWRPCTTRPPRRWRSTCSPGTCPRATCGSTAVTATVRPAGNG
nr:hypothetical protein GCM10020093_116530 [Planobispora longispora]